MNRYIEKTVAGRFTTDGDGVSLKRVLSFPHKERFDPFLMLDSFGTDQPDPLPGFPWHPHRGIITITYLISGAIEHEDSLGNHGIIGAGGLQWMSAGSGIIHREQPWSKGDPLKGYQLWLNLPQKSKMSDPQYGDFDSDSFSTIKIGSANLKVIAGDLQGVEGRLKLKETDPQIYDIRFEETGSTNVITDANKLFFAVALSGKPLIDKKTLEVDEAALLSLGDEVLIRGVEGDRVLLIGGNPLNEPIAWQGPIVMNTQSEITTAFDELDSGTFVKKGSSKIF